MSAEKGSQSSVDIIFTINDVNNINIGINFSVKNTAKCINLFKILVYNILNSKTAIEMLKTGLSKDNSIIGIECNYILDEIVDKIGLPVVSPEEVFK